MEINYIVITLGFFIFAIGLFAGLNTVKFFSDEIIDKLEEATNTQIKINQSYLKNATTNLINKIDEKIDFVQQINEVLGDIKEHLYQNKLQVEKLNNECDIRKTLEVEIIKLKKIISRIEKRK